ncbi:MULTISPECIES: hypothetical protein [Sphingobacterium]|uniref:hypothetical protein n=1 Tax=Sphingobacterium TaxID=28453 RepID=UPI0013DA89F5|nr:MULTISPECIES: hypothetical protein [unclassified Sphingobacterium]
MKTVITLLIATILTVSMCVAQEKESRQNRPPEERAKMQVERLTKELELNKSQQDSIYIYILQSMKTSTLHRKENDQAQIKKSLEARNLKIKSFLTPEQITQYEELQNRRKNRRSN